MVLIFKRNLEPSDSKIPFNGKHKVQLLDQALKKVLKDPSTLDAVRYSLLRHAHLETKLSVSALDASFERRLKKEFRSHNKGTIKAEGIRNVTAAISQKPAITGKKRPAESDEEFQEESDSRAKSVPEAQNPVESAQETPKESAQETPKESAPEPPEAPVESAPSDSAPAGEAETAPIQVDELPEQVLEEYTEVTDKGEATLPSGIEEGKQEEEKTLGDLEGEIPPPEGKTVGQMMIDVDFDNGGHDIMIVDNGGDTVKREMMNDVIRELQGNFPSGKPEPLAETEEGENSPLKGANSLEGENSADNDVEMEAANVPLPEEGEDELEEFPPKKQEKLPEEDTTMKISAAEKKEQEKRERFKDIENVIFQKIAKNEREFMQAMSGTHMTVASLGDGLFIRLKKSKRLQKEIEGAKERQSEFVKERLRLQEKDKNKRILELRLAAAADTVNSALDIYKNNADKIVEKIRVNPANRSLITSSYRDPDTFNQIKYLTDANGDLIINEATGAPYIESISALSRDDAAKLIKQRRAVDGSDLPSSYYPMYGKQAKEYFSKHEYSFLGRQFVNGKKLKTAATPPNIRGRIKELLSMIGGSIGIDDMSIREPVFKQWVELETLKSSYDNYTATADYQYEQDRLALDQDGKLIDENAMASAAKILQNITAQQLIKAMGDGQAALGASEGAIQNEPENPPAEPNADKTQEKGEVGEDEMDVEKNPEKMQQESVNLASWMNSQKSYNPPSRARVFEPTNFPAFGGDSKNLGGIWV